jgi:hypothetical protein
MPLYDHPYSDVNIIYSVVQTGERTTDRGTNSDPNIKRLCNGEYRPGQLYILPHRPWGPTLEILQKPWQECLDIILTSFIEGAPYWKEDSTWHTGRWSIVIRLCNGEYRPGQLYILPSRVAPDTTDADVHALCTKPAVLKIKESGKSSRNHRTVRGTTETTLLNFVVNWFTFTKNGFLFFSIVKMENVGLSVDFHWTLWKSSRPLIYLMSAGFGCSSDSSMVSFGNPLRIFCSISRVGPQGLYVWSNSLKGGAGNTCMSLHDQIFILFVLTNGS